MSNSFWLILIGNSTVSASLVSDENGKFDVVSIGPKIKWVVGDDNSIVSAVDQSLSIAGQSINLPVDSEPGDVSFIIPPDWVGSDDKIFTEHKKILSNLIKGLNLKPMGYIAYDEAIIEYPTYKDNSYILLHLHDEGFFCSLVYFGKIKNKIVKKYSEVFHPEFLEVTLIESKIDSAIPPQIIVFGNVDDSTEDILKNYSWLGKKNIETFLHSPSIQVLGEKELINILARFITQQLHSKLSVAEPVEEVIQEEVKEVNPEKLGFSNNNIENITPLPIIEEIHPKITPPKFKLKLKFPKIHFKFKPFLYIFALSPILILIPIIFAHTDIDLFINPYVFSQKTDVILDWSVEEINMKKNIIPVIKKTIPVTISSSTKTTGQKTVGEKAKGEITIYNKSDKTQNISKGATLIDKSGKKFEVTNSVSVSAGIPNLDQGIINLGQTKIIITAQDIGPEYNIPTGDTLSFKDVSESILVAKVNESFVGGSRRNISAVSTEDKKTIEQKIQESIALAVDEKIKTDLSEDGNIIKESIQSKTSRIEYNREIGEEADELTADVSASVSFLVLSEATKNEMILSLLSSDDNYSKALIDPKQFNLNIKINKNGPEQSFGTAEISGNALPKIDYISLQKNLTGKSKSEAEKIIKVKIPRTYKIIINHRLPLLTFFNLLPFRYENISIIVKSESL